MRRLNLKAFHVPIVAACRKTAFGGILGCGNYCLDVCRCIQVVGQPSVSVYKSGTNAQNLTMAPPFSMQSANLLGMLSNRLCRFAEVISALAACSAPHNSSKVVHGCILPSFSAIIAQTFSMGLKSGLFAGQGSRRPPGARALASTIEEAAV